MIGLHTIETAGSKLASFYVRLSPTVLYPAPDCYGKLCTGKQQCGLCPVREQCESGVEVETR